MFGSATQVGLIQVLAAMGLSLRLFVITLFLSGCSTAPTSFFRDARTEIHDVSVQELLGRPSEFDNQPIRVIGVAGFNFGFEGFARVYTTVEDQRHLTNSFIKLGDFSPSLRGSEKDIERLNGNFVVVEGVFHAKPLQRIPQSPGYRVLCMGECTTSGTIADVTRISLWDF